MAGYRKQLCNRGEVLVFDIASDGKVFTATHEGEVVARGTEYEVEQLVNEIAAAEALERIAAKRRSLALRAREMMRDEVSSYTELYHLLSADHDFKEYLDSFGFDCLGREAAAFASLLDELDELDIPLFD